MATNRTFTMIKPDAVKNGHIGAILNDINAAGFKIVALKYTKLSAEKAGEFYDVHAARPFYGELVSLCQVILSLQRFLKKTMRLKISVHSSVQLTLQTLQKVLSAKNMQQVSARTLFMVQIPMRMLRLKVLSTLQALKFLDNILMMNDE